MHHQLTLKHNSGMSGHHFCCLGTTPPCKGAIPRSMQSRLTAKPSPSLSQSDAKLPATPPGFVKPLPRTIMASSATSASSGANPVGSTSASRSTCATSTATTSRNGSSSGGSSDDHALIGRLLSGSLGLSELMAEARRVRDQGHTAITFSPKVFIPLTRLCRDSCGYCTFAQPPRPGRHAYMRPEEVLAVARLGAQQGCTEALFTMGDKPELRWPEAAAELAAMGYRSTLDYVEAVAGRVMRETGLLPHINAGVMGEEDLRRLKSVSASQGLMLEGVAPGLLAPGGPHHGCPDKAPGLRLETIEAAGRAGVPFTSGILIGLGESRAERLAALQALRALHLRYGHIQEIIVQNFRAKPGTAMSGHGEPPLEEVAWTVAAARLMFGPSMNIQAPPNLTPDPGSSSQDMRAGWRLLLDAGINDWGGISPVTRDFVNPEKPWPHLADLAAATAEAGFLLLPRLPVYPPYTMRVGDPKAAVAGTGAGHPSQRDSQAESAPAAADGASSSSSISSSSGCSEVRWLECTGGAASVAAAVWRAMDSEGLARGSEWSPGKSDPVVGGGEGHAVMTQAAGLLMEGVDRQDQTATASTSAPGGCGSSGSSGSSTSSGQPQRQAKQPATPAPRPRQSQLWQVSMAEDGTLRGCPSPSAPSPDIQALLARVLEGQGQGWQGGGLEWGEAQVERLLQARGADFWAVCRAADELRARVCGDSVSYVVNRNINYTNVCKYKCAFCAFSKGQSRDDLRGPSYLVPLEEIRRRAEEAWSRGATEVCMQGGIHPDFTGATYLDILAAAKRGAAGIHVHAFSPLEVWQGASTLGLPLPTYLGMLKDAGLGSLPGTAAEVLDPHVRAVLCPDKITHVQWLEVMEAAHAVGLPSTSTLMFGHLEAPATWAIHLLQIRRLQARTGGFTEFVPLPFVHMEAPVYLRGRARRGPTLRECILLHAVARLVLHPHITNIQASWVKMGPSQAARLLACGCNDMGGSIMNESITRAAGASHGQELPPAEMEAIIRVAGRVPRQRTTRYGTPDKEQTQKSFQAAPLAPVLTAVAPKQQPTLVMTASS